MVIGTSNKEPFGEGIRLIVNLQIGGHPARWIRYFFCVRTEYYLHKITRGYSAGSGYEGFVGNRSLYTTHERGTKKFILILKSCETCVAHDRL